jgi:hypothetical protein
MRKILVSTISFVNTEKQGSEIYTTFAKRLVDDVINKTPYDIMVSTNRPELFDSVQKSERIIINGCEMGNHKTHVAVFNQLLKFYAIKNIDSKYDWVLYLDCDAGFTSNVDVSVIEEYIDNIELEGFDMSATRTNATYEYAEQEFLETTDFDAWPKPLFNNKFRFYGIHPEWKGAKLPSEHILLLKNNDKLSKMATHFEDFCTQFETQQPDNVITYDMEAFEIGVSAHLAGYIVRDMSWGQQNEIFKVGFNANNWEKVKI